MPVSLHRGQIRLSLSKTTIVNLISGVITQIEAGEVWKQMWGKRREECIVVIAEHLLWIGTNMFLICNKIQIHFCSHCDHMVRDITAVIVLHRFIWQECRCKFLHTKCWKRIKHFQSKSYHRTDCHCIPPLILFFLQYFLHLSGSPLAISL